MWFENNILNIFGINIFVLLMYFKCMLKVAF